eukprot:TRINITY_DN4976_c0_g1_i1.p1 TRINITY_DN4976_c0_g1~~TRINITY_DN4976_c0_g1_i1.p1  ORF type:complete len:181 (-),score=23.16 TRINITY_DN4976_c0_g1_i1:19-531(-)
MKTTPFLLPLLILLFTHTAHTKPSNLTQCTDYPDCFSCLLSLNCTWCSHDQGENLCIEKKTCTTPIDVCTPGVPWVMTVLFSIIIAFGPWLLTLTVCIVVISEAVKEMLIGLGFGILCGFIHAVVSAGIDGAGDEILFFTVMIVCETVIDFIGCIVYFGFLKRAGKEIIR